MLVRLSPTTVVEAVCRRTHRVADWLNETTEKVSLGKDYDGRRVLAHHRRGGPVAWRARLHYERMKAQYDAKVKAEAERQEAEA